MVRFKNRYLLTQIVYKDWRSSSAHVSANQVHEAISESLALNFGDFGVGANGTLNVKRFSEKSKDLCIIRCPRDNMRMVWGAITFVSNISGVSLSFNVLHVAGTLKQCKLNAKDQLREMLKGVECDTESSEDELSASSESVENIESPEADSHLDK
eukprot:TRINITY_DN15892_c0_g1_i1.p1 TRINITY_DN15892_c0_g1~~TRINITY_DN15892_c0_g1_i1.p1  ORF type:complete len:155 (+),score=21.19 TRINITY_DN15892_c0_g1_i1:50-514(+)